MTPEPNYRISSTFRWLGSSPIENAELFLTVCGIEKCPADKFYGPAIRDDYHVHFILNGKGTLKIGDTSYFLGRGQIFVIPPDIETYYYADPKDPWHYTWVSFGGSKAALYLEKAGITASHPIRDTYIQPEDFLAYTEKILDHHELTIANELTRTALLYEILALLVQSQNQTQQSQDFMPDYSPELYVNYALEYIHNNYAHVRVQDIASYIGIARSYLTRIFKQQLKTSPQEYILGYRMEQGRRLLCTTGLSVQEVALQIGYGDPLAFSKAFKHTFGLSPKHYREQALTRTAPTPPQSPYS